MLYDSMPASALDKVVTFAGDVLFERKTPDFDKAGGDRIDLRTPGQPEEPLFLNEREAKTLLISSLIKQVLKSNRR